MSEANVRGGRTVTHSLSMPARSVARRALLILGALLFLGLPARAGLYDDDANSIKGGDIKDRDYWRAKFDSIQLETAIKERQPEGAIYMAIISQVNLLDDLAKKYPNDEDFKKWKARAVEIKTKIGEADRGGSFKPGSLWNEHNYREAWVNLNYAKIALAQEDWATAKDGSREAEQQLQFLSDRVKNNDRVAAWPDGTAAWVKDSVAENAKMQEQIAAKLK
jgi:hypothetical protein